MSTVTDVKLEFLRGGPPHNQLLSPLTRYMALCGADGPVDVAFPFEHAQLLDRLNRLRYEVDGVSIPPSQREAEVRDLGQAVARILAKVRALMSSLDHARAEHGRLVNIRLAISAFELSMVPFETTMTPNDASGLGSPLLLKTTTNITREIRRGEPLKVEWNRAPRILFAFASPADLPAVPAAQHVRALRRALAPWVAIDPSPEKRLVEVEKLLTVLPDATLSSISDACQANDYTHVHILAHGAPMPGPEVRRFGIALANERDPDRHVVVDGQSLALALKGTNTDGRAKSPPTVVSLATCDSGNASAVIAPGGSIAHELHVHDIPWVIASQFPLWMHASNVAAEILYTGLLKGNDPRWVLHELRNRLRVDFPKTHDWASIVAYAAIAPDLDAQVEAFRTRQTRKKIEVLFARMDQLVGADAFVDDAESRVLDADAEIELKARCDSLRAELDAWRLRSETLANKKEKAEREGVKAASEKRIAIIYNCVGMADLSRDAYERSRRAYQAALQLDPASHWLRTQQLALAAIPLFAGTGEALDAMRTEGHSGWLVARQLAQWQLVDASGEELAWAHGTLAELELLGAVYEGEAFDVHAAKARILDHCDKLREAAGDKTFPIKSTHRQFGRYLKHWDRPAWQLLARAAFDALKVS